MMSRTGQGAAGSGQSTPRQVPGAAGFDTTNSSATLPPPPLPPGGGAGSASTPMEMEQPPRPGTVDQVHWLLQTYNLRPNVLPSALHQCSSSLFVLICSRLMNSPQSLTGIITQPDTYQKKVHNIRVVLSAIESIRGKRLEYISAHEIVMLNETHIGYLVALFVEVAVHIIEIEEQRRSREQSSTAAATTTAAATAGGPTTTFEAAAADDPELSEVRADTEHSGSHEYGVDEEGAPGEEGEYNESHGESEPYDQLIERWKQDLVQPRAPSEQVLEMRRNMAGVLETFSRFEELYGKQGPTPGQGVAAHSAVVGVGAAPASASAAHRQRTGAAATNNLRRQQYTNGTTARTSPPHPNHNHPHHHHHVPQHRPRISGQVTYVDGVPMGTRHHTGFNIMATLPGPLHSVLQMGTGTGAAMPGSGNGAASANQQQQLRRDRDDRIAMLRNKKLLNMAQQDVQSGLRSQHSLAEAAMAEFGRSVQKQRRRDLADLKKKARDEDTLERAAYLRVIGARKQNMVSKAWLAKDELYYDPPNANFMSKKHRPSDNSSCVTMTEGHTSDHRPTDTVLAAKKALAEYAVINNADMVAEYRSYRDNLSDWKNVVRV